MSHVLYSVAILLILAQAITWPSIHANIHIGSFLTSNVHNLRLNANQRTILTDINYSFAVTAASTDGMLQYVNETDVNKYI